MSTDTETQSTDTYRELARPFLKADGTAATHSRKGGSGVMLDYLTGEQVVTRMNETLGVNAWTFSIREHGVHAEADEAWCLGRLDAIIDGNNTFREQFGSQKLKRSSQTSVILDLGFDLKGAATDCLKKCASLLGVGLYLSSREETTAASVNAPTPVQGQAQRAANNRPQNAASGPPAPRNTPPAPIQQPAAGKPVIICTAQDCGAMLQETKFRDGTIWTAADLANNGTKKHRAVLCMEHYRAANDAARRNAS